MHALNLEIFGCGSRFSVEIRVHAFGTMPHHLFAEIDGDAVAPPKFRMPLDAQDARPVAAIGHLGFFEPKRIEDRIDHRAANTGA